MLFKIGRPNGRIATGLLIAALACGVGSASAATHRIPRTTGAFTRFVARQFRAALPSANIKVVHRLALNVAATPSGTHLTDLHTLYSTCRRNADVCGDEMEAFVTQMTTLYETPNAPLQRSALRIIVRPYAYVEHLRATSTPNPIAAPLYGNYWMIAVADHPTAIQMLDARDLAPLKLSAGEALAIGKKNMTGAVRAFLEQGLEGRSNIGGLLSGDSYESSAFAFPELWAPLAHAFGDNLLVSVPSSDVVLFSEGGQPHAETSMIESAKYIMARAERPFSPALFRWSRTGWQAVMVADTTLH